jgi:hypothetical protein
MGIAPTCCSGVCTDIALDDNHCGSCSNKAGIFPRFVIEKEMGDSVANYFFLFSALESSQPVAWEVAQISPTIRITAEAVSLFLVKESARHAVLGPVLT